MNHLFNFTEKKQIEKEIKHSESVSSVIEDLLARLTGRFITQQQLSDAVLEGSKIITESEQGYVSLVGPAMGNMIVISATPAMRQFADSNKIRVLFPQGNKSICDGQIGRLLNNRKPFYTNDPDGHKLLKDIARGNLHVANFLSVPAAIGDSLIGQISLANSPRDYTDQDLSDTMLLARLYALGIQRAETCINEPSFSMGRIDQRIKERVIELEKDNHKLLSGVRAMLKTEAMLKELLREKEQLLSGSLIDFREYCLKLVDGILSSSGDNQITTSADFSSMYLDKMDAIQCGLIINEIVTDLLRPGSQGETRGQLSISFKDDSMGRHVLKISGNRVGSPAAVMSNRPPASLDRIRALVRRISGTVDVLPGGCTGYIITFPVDQACEFENRADHLLIV